MGWESSLMSWFDIGKLVEASLLVVGSILVGFAVSAFLTGSAASTNFFSGVAPLAGVTSLPTLVAFCVTGVFASLVGVTSGSFLSTLVVFCVVSFAFVCLSLSCVVSWPCVGFWPCIASATTLLVGTVSANTAWLLYSIKVVPNNTDATPTDNFRTPQRCFPSACFCW